MLVLSRKVRQRVVIDLPDGRSIGVQVLRLGRGKVVLGFEADRQIHISRPDAKVKVPIPVLATRAQLVPMAALLPLATETPSWAVWVGLAACFVVGAAYGVLLGRSRRWAFCRRCFVESLRQVVARYR